MLANSELQADPFHSTPRLQAVPAGRCFLGLPGHSASGEALWLQRALGQLLPRHDGVLILLEAELGAYDELVPATAGERQTSLPATPDRLTAHTLARWQEVDAVRRGLDRADQGRVQLATWSHFADGTFVALWRQLLTAFGVNSEFRADVLRRWISQQRSEPSHLLTANAARLSCLREIESLAMRLRVSELSGYDVEYGRTAEPLLAGRLYAGGYASDGLTVENLVGHPPRRIYRRLD